MVALQVLSPLVSLEADRASMKSFNVGHWGVRELWREKGGVSLRMPSLELGRFSAKMRGARQSCLRVLPRIFDHLQQLIQRALQKRWAMPHLP